MNIISAKKNKIKTKMRIIKHYEGLHDGDLKTVGLQPKMDPVGIWTEGWGHAMVNSKGAFIKGKANKTLAYASSKIKTVEDADKYLLLDLSTVNLLIARKIKVKLNANQVEALQSFYFNCGYSETLTSLINAKSSDLFNWWTTHYITGQGSKIPLGGLVYRRKTEATLFTTGALKFYNT